MQILFCFIICVYFSVCFKIFDKDCDGCLSEHEIRMMVEGLISAYQTSFGQVLVSDYFYILIILLIFLF